MEIRISAGGDKWLPHLQENLRPVKWFLIICRSGVLVGCLEKKLRQYQVIIYLSFHAYDWRIKYTQQNSYSFPRDDFFFSCGCVGSIHSISTLMLIILDYW